MGLILSGAMAGGGAALQQSGMQLSRQWGAEELEKMREEAANSRQAALLEAQKFMEAGRQAHTEKLQDKAQTFQSGERKSGQEFQRGLITEVQQPFQREQQERGFTQAKSMQDAQQKFQAEQNAQQRTLTREQIASHERVAAANNATAMKVASMGGTVQQDKDGNMLFFDKSGNPTQIMDPNNPGKPLKGYKDLTPAAKAYADVIKAQLVGLNTQEASGAGDPAAIAQKRVQLNTQLLNVLTGGIDSAQKQSYPTPPADAVEGLRARRGNAAAVAKFESDFGPGSASRYLEQGRGIIGLGLATEPSGSEPHLTITERRRQEREKNAQMKTDREEREKALREEYGNAGY